MISIGEVHCDWCGDAFEPEGIPSFDDPNFCSDECESARIRQDADLDAYSTARYGSAPVF